MIHLIVKNNHDIEEETDKSIVPSNTGFKMITEQHDYPLTKAQALGIANEMKSYWTEIISDINT